MSEYKINLSEGFDPYGNFDVLEYDYSVFPGGEPFFRLKNTSIMGEHNVRVSCRINNSEDLMKLCVAVDALRRGGYKNINAYIPYFPAARQDRVCNSGESLTVKVYADIINSLNFDEVRIFDPHSDVTAALINNCKIINNHAFIHTISRPYNVVLVSPDAGSNKKMHSLCKGLGITSFIRCDKHRDSNGKIVSFDVYVNELDPSKTYLIVDDICDGGGTFIGLAKRMRELGATKLQLAVSHGIFSHGFGQLSNYFEEIYTTNSFDGQRNNKVKEYEL